MWEPCADAYSIEVKDPEKKKKFKGIKSFTAFSVIPSSTGRGVSRRYKHYAWLHDRLEEKFIIHCVPPLPDKQFYGESWGLVEIEGDWVSRGRSGIWRVRGVIERGWVREGSWQ